MMMRPNKICNGSILIYGESISEKHIQEMVKSLNYFANKELKETCKWYKDKQKKIRIRIKHKIGT